MARGGSNAEASLGRRKAVNRADDQRDLAARVRRRLINGCSVGGEPGATSNTT